MPSRVDDLCASFAQVLLATLEQFATDALALMCGTNADETDHADGLRVERVARHGRMGPADNRVVSDGDKESIRIEDRLGENVSFDERVVRQMWSTAADNRFIPDRNQSWRVSIAKGAVLEH